MIVKKKYRLKKDRDFKKVIAANHTVKNRSYVVYHLPNEMGFPRIGISVSKKLGNAVVRNRTRRQVRAMLDQELQLDQALDLLIIIRLEFLAHPFEDNASKLHEIIEIVRRPVHE
jgi:ribonuclease P protein component